MGTMYQLGYVRQLDMGCQQRAAQRDLPHIGPEYTAPRTPSVTPSFAGKYCTDKESMTRLTAVPLHKQKPKLLGSVSLPYGMTKKKSRFSFSATASGAVLPRPTTANAGATGPHASLRLSNSAPTGAAAAPTDDLESRLLEARLATANLFKPRTPAAQTADRLLEQSVKTAPKPCGRKLHLLPPYATGLTNERKLRLLQKAHMTETHAAITLQKCLRGNRARTEHRARTTYVSKKERRRKISNSAPSSPQTPPSAQTPSTTAAPEATARGGFKRPNPVLKAGRRQEVLQAAEMRRVFTWFDRNRDGGIDAAELHASVRSLGGASVLSLQEAQDVVWEHDDDSDGKLDWDEFRNAYARAERDVSGFAPRRFFAIVDFLLMDSDFSGSISRDEAMKTLFERHGNSSRMDQMISDFFDEFGGSHEQMVPTSPLDYVPATFYSEKLDAGEVPEDATISFAHFYSRFGAYIPQVMSGHQLAHAYGGRARHSLSPPRSVTVSRPTLGGARAPVAVRPVFRPGGGDPPRNHLRGSRKPSPSTAIAPARSAALLRSSILGDAPPPTPPPQSQCRPVSAGAHGTISATLAARAVGPRMLGNRAQQAGAKPDRTARMAEIFLFGNKATNDEVATRASAGHGIDDIDSGIDSGTLAASLAASDTAVHATRQSSSFGRHASCRSDLHTQEAAESEAPPVAATTAEAEAREAGRQLRREFGRHRPLEEASREAGVGAEVAAAEEGEESALTAGVSAAEAPAPAEADNTQLAASAREQVQLIDAGGVEAAGRQLRSKYGSRHLEEAAAEVAVEIARAEGAAAAIAGEGLNAVMAGAGLNAVRGTQGSGEAAVPVY
jgi:Ca2+-binding EF-hand superfamily protein